MLNILIVICVVGFLLFLVNTHLPMEGTLKKVLNIVVIAAVIVWLLKVFHLFHFLEKF